MKSAQRPEMSGQVVSLERSPQYWRRRAQQHRKRGEHSRAAALLRHAVALEPSSGDLRVEYAKSLRDMSCFEASNREAFGALALEPGGAAPYRIIGRNMLSLGREQEAMDAFSHYFEKAWKMPEIRFEMENDEEFYELEELWDTPSGGRKARLDALCHIGASRLARGKLESADKTLARARELSPKDERLYTLSAMLCEARQEMAQALIFARAAAEKNPRHVSSLCALASIRAQLGQRGLAAAALLRAAFYCRFPQDEQLFCFTASTLNMPEIALAMLRLSKHRCPERLPTLFNCAVTLLQLGRMEQAQAYLHRCLEGDPEDLVVQALFHQAKAWEKEALCARAVAEKAQALPFYPFLPHEAVTRLLTALGDAFEAGMEAFAARLITDGECYRGFLYALLLPGAPFSRLLFPVTSAVAALDGAAAERILRDILVQNAVGDTVKRYALSALVSLEAKPPYVIWQNGRILQVALPGESVPQASVVQRHIARRIRKLARQAKDQRIVGHTLSLLYRMSSPMRHAFAADQGRVWSCAVQIHFELTYTKERSTTYGETDLPGLGEKPQIRKAVAKLCALMPLS